MQSNSDPLPYTQIDRAVTPKAIELSTILKATPQHALGSLVLFWNGCGDPREIERLLGLGKDEVVLSGAEVRRRFRIASGHDLDPEEMAAIGLLEARGEGAYRVRGMSRYFEPIRKRVQARQAASAGGKASAESRKRTHGTAQPRSGVASTVAQAEPEAPPKRHRSDARSATEATLEAPPNTEVSGQRSPLEKTSSSGGGGFFARVQEARRSHGFATERPPHPNALGAWFSDALMELNGDEARLWGAYEHFAESDHWAKATPPWPFTAFMKLWRDFVPRKSA